MDEVDNKTLSTLLVVLIVILLAQCFFAMRTSEQIQEIFTNDTGIVNISVPIFPTSPPDCIMNSSCSASSQGVVITGNALCTDDLKCCCHDDDICICDER